MPVTLMSWLFLGASPELAQLLTPGQQLPRALGGLVWGVSENQGCRSGRGLATPSVSSSESPLLSGLA